MEVGRASLMQMSEISRRANSWSNSDGWSSDTQSQAQSSSAPGSLFPSGTIDGTTRAEALAKVEEIYRGRIANSSINGSAGVTQQWSGLEQQRQESAAEEYAGDASQQSQQLQQPTQQTGTSNSLWNASSLNEDPSKAMMHEGLQVYTVGHLVPRSVTDGMNNWGYDPSTSNTGYAGPSGSDQSQRFTKAAETQDGADDQRVGESMDTDDEEEERVMPSPMNDSFPGQPPPDSSTSTSVGGPSNLGTIVPAKASSSTAPGAKSKKLRVRRSTFIPDWAVPPRVLLVDDDIVSRKLGSKFLQVFGCTIDVAVDGVSAVNKMNLEKYDLVLMVCSFHLFLVLGPRTLICLN